MTSGGLDWAALHERHARELGAFAYRLLDDSRAARQVVDDTFARAIEREHTLHVPEATRPWLYRLAAELAAGRRRRRAIAARIPLLAAAAPAAPLDGAAPVRRALGAIPTDQAVALLLADAGFGRDEIAEITDTGEETVTLRLHAGRAAFAAAYRPPGDRSRDIDEGEVAGVLRAAAASPMPPLPPSTDLGRRAPGRSVPLAVQAAVVAGVLVVAAIVGVRLPDLRRAIEPAPTPSPVPVATMSLLAERDMAHFAAQDGALLATSFVAGPRRSLLHRALLSEGRWEQVHETDATITLGGSRGWAVHGPRVALVEQRSEPDGTDVRRVVIVDLDQQVARTTVVDEFLLTPAAAPTGGYRRGVVQVVLDARTIAWTRLIEERSLDARRPSNIATELRLAAAHLPTASVLVAPQALPIGFTEGGLVYAISPASGRGSEIRFRDNLTGADRLVHSEPSDPRGGRERTMLWTAVLAGEWVVWRGVVDPPTEAAPRGALRAMSVRTGELQELGPLEPGCAAPTAGERYVAVACGSRTMLFDARTLEPADHPAPLPPALPGRVTASGDGLVIQQPDAGGRRLVYLRPPPRPAAAAPAPTPVAPTPRPTCAPEPAERRIREFIEEFNRQDPAAIRHIDLWARGGNHSTFSVSDPRRTGPWRPEVDLTRRIDVQRYLAQRYAQQEQLVLREITHRAGGWDREGILFQLVLERRARDLDPNLTEASASVEIRCPHGTLESWRLSWPGASPWR